MKTSQTLTLQHFTDHCSLTVEYVDDLPPTCAGYLDPSTTPRYIAVNSTLPKHEQVFTVAHELAHFVLHHGKARKHYYSFILDRHPHDPRLDELLAFLRRYARLRFNRDWEADAFAIIMLVGLGQAEVLLKRIELHPEDLWWVLYASISWRYISL